MSCASSIAHISVAFFSRPGHLLRYRYQDIALRRIAVHSVYCWHLEGFAVMNENDRREIVTESFVRGASERQRMWTDV